MRKKHKGVYSQWNWSSETKTNPENSNNCSSKCALYATSVHNATVQLCTHC